MAANHYHLLVRNIKDALVAALDARVTVAVVKDEAHAQVLLAGQPPLVALVMGPADSEPAGPIGDKRPAETFPIDVMILAPMVVEDADIDGLDVLSLLAAVRAVLTPQAGYTPITNCYPVQSLGFGAEALLPNGTLLRDRYTVKRPPWAG